eukprot:PhF_6_TR2570/c0_g1_i1/m.4354
MHSANVSRLYMLMVLTSMLGAFWLLQRSITTRIDLAFEQNSRKIHELSLEVRTLRLEEAKRANAAQRTPAAVPPRTPAPTSAPTPAPPTPEPTQARNKRVAILTMNVAGGRDWIYPMSFRNRLAYAKKWNIDLIVEGDELVDRSRDVCWSKIPMLKRWLPHYDWVMWMDGDAFFMDAEKSLDTVLDDKYDFIVAKDWNDINLGIFFIKNSPYSFQLLEDMWNVPRQHWYPFEEQSALHHLTSLERNRAVAEQNLKHIKFPPQRDINAYPDEFSYGNQVAMYRKGDFIAHFPNCKNIGSCQGTISRYYNEVMKDPITNPPLTYFPGWWSKGLKK